MLIQMDGGGFSLMYSLLFENTALCGECVFHWVCKSRKKKDETEGSENERASNYMTDLASGSLWLNRAPFPDITPQSFHNILPLSLMPVIFSSTACESFAAVCVYVCVFSHFGPTRTANSGTCFSLWSPAFPGLSAWVILAPDILTQGMRWGFGLCVVCLLFLSESSGGITRCYSPAAVAVQWILLFRPLDNKVDSLLEELSAFCSVWLNRQRLCYSRLCGRSAALCCFSLERFFSVSVDGLVGVWTEKASTYICMCECLAP